MTEPNNPMLRDPGLSRLYQAGAEVEPPASLDALILSASREALAPRPAPRSPWWTRLAVPASLAASTVLAVMLSLTMARNPQESADSVKAEKAAPASEPAPAALPAPLPVPAPAAKALADQAPVVREAAPPPAGRFEKKAKAVEEAVPLARDSAIAPATVPPAAPAPMPAPVATEGRLAAPAVRADKLENTASERASVTPSPAPAAASVGAAAAPQTSTAKRAVSGAPRPEIAWLDEIRQLRREGKLDEAARRLAEFRAAYPDYALPDDLK